VIEDAFPGARIEVAETDGYFELTMRQTGLLRPLRMVELSDGAVRYLLLTAALLSPRPPSLMVLDEPESSLHPQLLAPLARLIARAALGAVSGAKRITLEKQFGETIVSDDDDPPLWTWPHR
jgi:predicted ATPase